MRRVEDILDVWFDSGSMPYAQVHYPFENADWFEHHYPGDFIVEYIGQTRGWFYTMHILATALFDRPAFSSCISHGIVLGSDGQKMSKSLRNYPDVNEVFDRDGADAMRWFLMSSPILRGGNLIVTEQGIRDGVRQVLIPLWNAWYFFTPVRQRGAAAGRATTPRSTSAPRMCSTATSWPRRAEFVDLMTRELDALNVAAACDATRTFLEVLSNWYIRRSRDRFWDGESAESLRGIRHALHGVGDHNPRRGTAAAADRRGDLARPDRWALGAPHRLADRPNMTDVHLVAAMDRVREVCSTGSALRKAEDLRVRLPLSQPDRRRRRRRRAAPYRGLDQRRAERSRIAAD